MSASFSPEIVHAGAVKRLNENVAHWMCEIYGNEIIMFYVITKLISGMQSIRFYWLTWKSCESVVVSLL